MPRMLFTFTLDTESGEAAVAGNIGVMDALAALQKIAIPLAVQQQMALAKAQAEQRVILEAEKEVENATAELPQQGEG